MSVDLFVYRTGSAITSEDLRKACENIARLYPGVSIDFEWDARDQSDFPCSQAFFWQVDRSHVTLAVPPNAEDFEIHGQSHGNFAYIHVSTNAHLFDFSEFLAHALAGELNAGIFDPQLGELVPVILPSLESLKDRHDAEIKQYSPQLKKEYTWLLSGEKSKSADENFELNAKKFNDDLTASMQSIIDSSFSGLRITRNTFFDLSPGLKLFASFRGNSDVNVLLTADLSREELFDQFTGDLAGRFGKAFRSRQKFVFPK